MRQPPAGTPGHSFDPYTAPPADDLAGRAVRLATACAVVSQLLANPPSPLLAENLHDGAMTDRWPLRDEVSLAAANELAEAAHEPLRLQQDDWDRLIGPGSDTRPLLSRLAPGAPTPPPKALGAPGTPGHLALLPRDHAAVVMARTGSMATRATAPSATPADTAAFIAVVRTMLLPLAPAVASTLREGARSRAYRAVAGLTLGIRDQAERLASDVSPSAGA
ncbi:hypothetical protein [Actinomyces haliotis]|uniref:hypothetical protein n=1 Tax=Actinomyces haliotis TaxID=1280843 RepID=UPI001890A9DF|nr:hypothetical protein [Actinomyces haliotis]